MKKEILEKFARFQVSRNISKEIKGGYYDGAPCNGVGCPSSGGSCQYQRNCEWNGRIYGEYSCSQPGTSQAVKDSTMKANPGVSFVFQGAYNVICTGVGAA